MPSIYLSPAVSATMLQVIILSHAVVLLVFLAAVARLRKSSWDGAKQQRKPNSKLPKGAWSLPFIGESVRFYVDGPYQFYCKHAQRYGSIFRSHILGCPAIVASTAEAAKFILSTQNKSFARDYPFFGRLFGLFAIKDEIYGPVRKAYDIHMFPRSHLRSQQEYITNIDGITRWAISTWDTQSGVTIHEVARKVTFHVMLDSIFTLAPGTEPTKVLDNYVHLYKWVEYPQINCFGSYFYLALKKRGEIYTWLLKEIAKRRTERITYKDVLQVLMDEVDGKGEKYSDEKLKEALFALIFAGYETTSVLLAWIVKYLGENPEILREVKDEHQRIRMGKKSNEDPLCSSDLENMPLTWRVVQETLRLANIAPLTMRSVREDVNFKGILFPKGWKVHIPFVSIHLNPEYYKDPMKFDPSRFEAPESKMAPFMPFGLGSRICSGRTLVKLESMIFIHYLVMTFNWKIIGTTGIHYYPFQRPTGLDVEVSKLSGSLL